MNIFWGDDVNYLGLMLRLLLINVVPFILVFKLVVNRRRQMAGHLFSELKLVAGEIYIVGIFGYVDIMSIYFFSIPVMRYMNIKNGFHIDYVEPDGFTVYLISIISFALVTCGIYLKEKRWWAWWLSVFLIGCLNVYAILSTLQYGFVSLIPITMFSYILFRLTRPNLKNELR